jgi:NYN domain
VSDVAPAVRRHAVLVDAGYLYAAVGQLVTGSPTRREFRIAAEPLIGALLGRAGASTPGELLRMYWYDAARDRVPTVEQRQIAALPHVKVRLGNLNSAGQQKGVDAQLRQDLEVLARHRAVSDVVLIAGDEDMVPAVEAAQAYGVRVHVWGIEPPYGVNQAERLVWEADTVDQLDAEFCRPYVEAEPAPEPDVVDAAAPAETDRPKLPTPAEVFAARKLPMPSPAAVSIKPPAPAAPHDRPGPERPEMEQIGARIAARWLLTRGRENVADLLPGPVLPTVIDKELLVEAEEEISRSLRPYEEARRALRDGFWARLHDEFGVPALPPDGAAAPVAAPAHNSVSAPA